MLIDSVYSYKLLTHNLSFGKFCDALSIAVQDRMLRNYTAKYLAPMLYEYTFCYEYKKISKLSFSKMMYSKFDYEFLKKNHMGDLNVSLIDSDFQVVFEHFKNHKVEKVLNKCSFSYKGEFDGFEFYKKDTKKHKKGDIRCVKRKQLSKEQKASTDALCLTLTYIARYGKENGTIEYIKENYEKSSKDKKAFYDLILNTVNKFTYERLYKVAITKRLRYVYRYSKAIEYKSLTFSGFSRKSDIISENTNKKSIIDAFVTLSWINRTEPLVLPVKYNKSFYGNYSIFNKNTRAFRYKLKFNDGISEVFSDDDILDDNWNVSHDKVRKLFKSKEITVILSKEGQRDIPVADSSLNDLTGIDKNCKHNSEMLDDGFYLDYDRELLKRAVSVMEKIDNNKEKFNINEQKRIQKLKDSGVSESLIQKKTYKTGKRLQNKLDAIIRALRGSDIQRSVIICKHMLEKNSRHAVLENLDGNFGKTFVKDEETDLNYNRLISLLNLSSFKDTFEHVARNYGICVSIVPSEYTSQMCPICGHISKNNRQSQEDFDCESCHHKANADHNSGLNIKQRVKDAVLREALLKQNPNKNGTFVPKKLYHDQIKELIRSCVMKIYGIDPYITEEKPSPERFS